MQFQRTRVSNPGRAHQSVLAGPCAVAANVLGSAQDCEKSQASISTSLQPIGRALAQSRTPGAV
jgi:hypothetical protein